MELRHRQLSSTPSSKRLAPQPGTSQSVARLDPLPDTSSGDSDDIWANPDYEQRGSNAHLAVQGVGLKGPGTMSPEIKVAKARGPLSVYPEPGDGNFNGERHGTAVQAGHRSPVCYITTCKHLPRPFSWIWEGREMEMKGNGRGKERRRREEEGGKGARVGPPNGKP